MHTLTYLVARLVRCSHHRNVLLHKPVRVYVRLCVHVYVYVWCGGRSRAVSATVCVQMG